MKIYQTLLLFLVVSLIQTRKKKKKKTKVENKPIDPKDKRPSNISPELFCDACLAIVKEAAKELRGKKKESDVLEVLENACDSERYYTYHHPPPEMREGCEAFVGAWDEEILQALTNRPDDETPVQTLCYQLTQACEGVDPGNAKKFDDTIMLDGQPIQIGQQPEDL